MDTKTLRAKSTSALVKEIEDAQAQLTELRFKRSSNQLKAVRDIRKLKRVTARIKTLLTQSETAEANKTE